MTVTARSFRSLPLIIACLAACCGTGCTSVISSAYLRDAFWETTEHAAEAEAEESADAEIDEAALAAADEDRRKAAIEEAASRLSRLGGLDDATRSTLIETLERTSQEDWPAVVDAFAESLGETASLPSDLSTAPAPVVAEPTAPEPHVVAKADLDAGFSAEPTAGTRGDMPEAPEPAAEDSEPVVQAVEDAAAPPAAPLASEVAATPPAQVPPEPVEPQQAADDETGSLEAPPTASPPVGVEPVAANGLAVRNACFATRVQAWGVVDRFAEDHFRPGQDVIVYFELDGLSAGQSPAGHTTCIDTTLRLTAADGSTVHDWSFEPIAETCRARRHDYFARYVVRIPESAPPGDCRLGIAVTDTLSGGVAEVTLPLAIAQPAD
jgi:hypothetical protein